MSITSVLHQQATQSPIPSTEQSFAITNQPSHQSFKMKSFIVAALAVAASAAALPDGAPQWGQLTCSASTVYVTQTQPAPAASTVTSTVKVTQTLPAPAPVTTTATVTLPAPAPVTTTVKVTETQPASTVKVTETKPAPPASTVTVTQTQPAPAPVTTTVKVTETQPCAVSATPSASTSSVWGKWSA